MGKSKRHPLLETLRSYDMFGILIQLNAAGEQTINSIPGALISAIIFILMMAYSIKQGLGVWERSSTITEAQVNIDPDAFHNFGENNNMIAFAVYDSSGRKFLNDPDYVKWTGQIGGTNGRTKFEMAPCEESQLSRFYSMSKKAQQQYDKAKSADALMCFKDMDLAEVQGNLAETFTYTRIYLDLIPCNSTIYFETEEGNERCTKTYNETMEYMGVPSVYMFANNQVFDQNVFGQGTIQNKTDITFMRFNPTEPSYVHLHITQNELNDQIDYVQVGQHVGYKYNQLTLQSGSSLSRKVDFPLEYKFFGIVIGLEAKVQTQSRQTYDIFAWMGDVGGLLGSFQLIGQFMIGNLSQNHANQFFTKRLFKLYTKDSNSHSNKVDTKIASTAEPGTNQQNQKLLTYMVADWFRRKPVPDFNSLQNMYETTCCCCTSAKVKRRQGQIDKGTSLIEKELDIINFIKTQRLFFVQMQCLLSIPQQTMMWALTQQALDSDSYISASESDGGDQSKEKPKKFISLQRSNRLTFLKTMKEPIKDVKTVLKSNKDIDKRLINIMKAKFDPNADPRTLELELKEFKLQNTIDQAAKLSKEGGIVPEKVQIKEESSGQIDVSENSEEDQNAGTNITNKVSVHATKTSQNQARFKGEWFSSRIKDYDKD